MFKIHDSTEMKSKWKWTNKYTTQLYIDQQLWRNAAADKQNSIKQHCNHHTKHGNKLKLSAQQT